MSNRIPDLETLNQMLSKGGSRILGNPLSPKVEKKAKLPKRNRYEEHAGELAQKIHAHKEQLNGSTRLWLPYPPSTNSRMAIVNGRNIKSAEARSYQRIIKEALVGMTPLTGDLEVHLTINRPQRSGDIDNVIKNVFDSLTGIAFIDDEQISDLHAQRYDGTYAKEFPGIDIQIKQVS